MTIVISDLRWPDDGSPTRAANGLYESALRLGDPVRYIVLRGPVVKWDGIDNKYHEHCEYSPSHLNLKCKF